MVGTWDELIDSDYELSELLERVVLDARSLKEWLRDYLEAHGLTKSKVVRESRLNQTFAYQIMAGTRRASRDKLIQLAFGMHMNVAATNDMLERAELSALRTSCARDIVIAYCLHHQYNLSTCDDMLWRRGMSTLEQLKEGVGRTSRRTFYARPGA